MKITWIIAAALAANSVAAQAQTPAAPPRPAVDKRVEVTSDLALLLALDARQRIALEAFLAAAAPPPPPPPADGPRPPAPGKDGAPPPPPPPPFLGALGGRRTGEAERVAAGRAFWATLSAEQRMRLDALTRLHALPLGGPPPRHRPGGAMPRG